MERAQKPTPTRPRTIQGYMTTSPWTIGREQTLSSAHKMMRAHDIRHLPVLDGGKLVGILSERVLALVETIPGVNPTELRVEEAMVSAIYRVSPEAPLAVVAEEMAERKVGSAVVMEQGRVVGVFTTVDSLRALAELAR